MKTKLDRKERRRAKWSKKKKSKSKPKSHQRSFSDTFDDQADEVSFFEQDNVRLEDFYNWVDGPTDM